MVWLLYVTLGKTPLADWNDLVDSEDPLDLIWRPEKHEKPTIGELTRDAIGAPPDWALAAPPRELMSLEAACHALKGATEADWEQAREDWRTIDGVIETWERVHSLYKDLNHAVKAGSVEGDVTYQHLLALRKITRAIPSQPVLSTSVSPQNLLHRFSLC